MGFLDTVFGRSKPVRPDLDRLFALPSAAVTLQAAVGFTATGRGAVCFATVEGAGFTELQSEIRELLDTDPERGGAPVEFERDAYGYSWLTSRRPTDALDALVTDLHLVNASLEGSGFGPQLLCSLVGFRDARDRSLALVYLYKRGTFYPFAPLPGDRRDNPLELEVRAAVSGELPVEKDLTRWFPVWGAPGL